VNQGKLRLLGHSMAPSTSPLGDVPAIGKTVPGYEFSSWIGLLGPKGLPAPIVDALQKAMVEALKAPALRKSFDSNGAVPTASTPQEFRTYLQQDIEITKKAVQIAGIKPE
jgi:tripartite-type tricarboxylate transporter receptor subunit TctC